MIFFDIDDTLIDSLGAHNKAILKLSTNYNLTIENELEAEELWSNITNFYLDKYFNNEVSLEEQRTNRLIDFWKNFGQTLSRSKAQTLYLDYHQFFINSCTLFDDTFRSLRKLSQHPLGIISNGVVKDQLYKLDKNNILDKFDKIIISESLGIAKPDPQIFTYAAKKSNYAIKDCIYIGNSYELDYIGAKEAGMKSFWLNRSEQKKEDMEFNFHTLDTIVEYLLQL